MGHKSLTWIRLLMICYIVPWWPSWLSDQIASSNAKATLTHIFSAKILTYMPYLMIKVLTRGPSGPEIAHLD